MVERTVIMLFCHYSMMSRKGVFECAANMLLCENVKSIEWFDSYSRRPYLAMYVGVGVDPVAK